MMKPFVRILKIGPTSHLLTHGQKQLFPNITGACTIRQLLLLLEVQI